MKHRNKVELLGNLGADPEIKNLPNGGIVANITIATTRKWTDKQTGQKQESTEWHKVVAFKRHAEIAQKYLKKGNPVFIDGSLRTRKWQDQQGNDRYTTEIVVDDITLVSSGNVQAQDNQQPQQPQAGYTGQPGVNQGNQAYSQQGHHPQQMAAPAGQPAVYDPLF